VEYRAELLEARFGEAGPCRSVRVTMVKPGMFDGQCACGANYLVKAGGVEDVLVAIGALCALVAPECP
jgi:hypothetical protein